MYFTDWIVKAFLWEVFLKLCVSTRCKQKWEIPFKLIWNLLVSWPSSSLLELEEWENDEHKLEHLLLCFFLLRFLLLFFLCLVGERDWEEKDVQRRFLVFHFLRDLPLFGLESRWISLCSILGKWKPSFSLF